MLDRFVPDLLKPILDFVDSVSLTRLLVCGNHALGQRICRLVTRFEHVCKPTMASIRKSCAPWPSIVSCFSNLEYLKVSTIFEHIIVSGVELTTLSPTLRSLELDFANGFLSLVELPRAANAEEPWTSLLRKEITNTLVNLKHLDWPDFYDYRMEKWSFENFVQEMTLLSIDSPALSHDLFHQYLPNDIDLSSRSHLDVFSLHDFRSDVPLMPSLTSLVLKSTLLVEDQHLNMIPWPQLVHLELEFCPTLVPHLRANHCLKSLTLAESSYPICGEISYLPPNLCSLKLLLNEFDLNLFTTLPRSLTILRAKWTSLHESLCQEDESEMRHFIDRALTTGALGLSETVFPSIRDRFVSKLPQNLGEMPMELFALIHPRDWDALPRSLHSMQRRMILRFEPATDLAPLVPISPDTCKYLPMLPRSLSQFRIIGILDAAGVANFGARWMKLLSLHVPPVVVPERRSLLMDMFRAIAVRFKYVETLELVNADEASDFDFELMHALDGCLVTHFELGYVNDVIYGLFAEELEEELRYKKETKDDAKKVKECGDENDILLSKAVLPLCFSRLQSINIHESVTYPMIDFCRSWAALLPSTLSSFVASCGHANVPTECLGQLPSSLETLRCSIMQSHQDFFKLLPRGLTSLDIQKVADPDHSEGAAPPWEYEYLLDLPPSLTMVNLPPTAFNRPGRGRFPDQIIEVILGHQSSTHLVLKIGSDLFTAETVRHIQFDTAVAIENYRRLQPIIRQQLDILYRYPKEETIQLPPRAQSGKRMAQDSLLPPRTPPLIPVNSDSNND